MVTVAQARVQLAQQRQILKGQRQTIRKISIPGLTAAQVRQQTRQSIISRGLQREELSRLKTKEIRKLDPFSTELDRFESRIKDAEVQIKKQEEIKAEITAAQEALSRGSLKASASKLTRKLFEQAKAQRLKDTTKIQEEIKALGFIPVPVFKDGKLIAFDRELPPEIKLPSEEKELTTTKIDVGDFPRPKAILSPGDLPPIIGVAKPPVRIPKFIIKASDAVADPRGSVGLFNLDRPLKRPPPLTPKQFLAPDVGSVTADVKPFIPTGGGTVIVTPRQKNFFETHKINPNAPSSIRLLEKVEIIDSIFENNLISEEVANKRLEDAVDEFGKAQIKEGVPKDIAFGVGLGVVSALFPPIGAAISVALLGDLFIKRREVLKQGRKAPVETLLSTGGFVLGTFIGVKGVKGFKGLKGRTVPKIDIKALREGKILSSKQTTKLVKAAGKVDPKIRVLIEQGKITDTSSSRITTPDGRVFEILQFLELKGPGLGFKDLLKGESQFIAFEIRPKGKAGEIAIGRAAQTLKGKTAESFVSIIRLKPAKTKLGKLVQQIRGRGQLIDIVQRTKTGLLTEKGTKVSFRTETGIVNVSTIKGSLMRRSLKIIEEIRGGKKANLSLIKTLINIQKRLDGQKPFTAKEFADSNFKTLTDTRLLVILKKLSLTAIEEIGGRRIGGKITLREGKLPKLSKIDEKVKGKPDSAFIIKEAKVEIAGASITKAKVDLTKLKIKKTSLEKTFAKEKVSFLKPKLIGLKDKFGRFKESILVRADKQKVTQEPFQSGVQQQAKRLPSRDPFPIQEVTRTRSSPASLESAIALAVAKPLKPSPPLITIIRPRSASGQVINTKGLTVQINSLQTRLKQTQTLRTNLSQVTSPSESTQNRLTNLQKTIQIQKLRLTQLQKLKLTPRQTTPTQRVSITPVTPKILITPIIPIIADSGKKKKLLVQPFKPKGKGYNVFVKSKGKFKKVNIKPIRKSRALDLGSFVTDQSLAATYKISRTNIKAKPPKVKFPKGYFGRTNKKFRAKLVKGKPIKNLAIEKRRFRLDTLREVNKIQAARFIAQLRKPALNRIKPFKFKRL